MEFYLSDHYEVSLLNVFLRFHSTENKFDCMTLNKEIENNAVAMFMKGICEILFGEKVFALFSNCPLH